MIQYKNNDVLIEFTPLENGKCEYIVNIHDLGNLESKIDMRLSYSRLNYYISQVENNRYVMNELIWE